MKISSLYIVMTLAACGLQEKDEQEPFHGGGTYLGRGDAFIGGVVRGKGSVNLPYCEGRGCYESYLNELKKVLCNSKLWFNVLNYRRLCILTFEWSELLIDSSYYQMFKFSQTF